MTLVRATSTLTWVTQLPALPNLSCSQMLPYGFDSDTALDPRLPAHRRLQPLCRCLHRSSHLQHMTTHTHAHSSPAADQDSPGLSSSQLAHGLTLRAPHTCFQCTSNGTTPLDPVAGTTDTGTLKQQSDSRCWHSGPHTYTCAANERVPQD